MPHESVAQPARQPRGAALAVHQRCGRAEFRRRDLFASAGRAGDGVVVGPCGQWSSLQPERATLVRHFLRFDAGVGVVLLARRSALTPAAHSPGVRGAATM